jgi:predicted ATPase/DNA-binding NarL/FixJ family response regulator
VTRSAQRSGNLPAEVTSFVGRRHELAELRQQLASTRLITLVGPGGVGKTRLAIRAATDLGRGFPDGGWIVELAELHDPALVDNAVLAALRLRDQSGADPADLLRTYLEDKHLLLVMDNCEHLLDPVARLVDHVLRTAPAVRVVATSREPLSIAGEHVLPVPPLPLPSPDASEPLARLRQNEAVVLFVERAAAASGGFALTEGNQQAVVDLCRRLDGLPLAIELAAVRTRALSPEQIRDRLGDRFALLTGGSRAALPRHQTLRTTIDWSYDLLEPAERLLLPRLSVFAGRFTLEDVEAVCSSDDLPAAQALDLLSSLLDKSLVVKEDADGAAWYRLHETMHEYSGLRLRQAGEDVAVHDRCADHYVERCRLFAAEGRHRLLDWLPWIEFEIDNVRAVLRRSVDQQDFGRALALTTSLIWYWITRATTEGVRWLDELLRLVPPSVVPPWTSYLRGFLAVLQNDPAAATPALERAARAARATDQLPALSQSLAMASIAATMTGDAAASRRLLDEARAAAHGLDDVGSVLMLRQAEALDGLLAGGDLDVVRSSAAAGARLSREAGDLYSLDMMLLNEGLAALRSGQLEESEQYSAEGLRIARRLDDRVAQCYLVGVIACTQAGSGEPRRAARLLGATDSLRVETGATVHAGLAPALAQATASLTGALGRTRFDTEFAAGQQLERGAATRLALDEDVPPSREGPRTQEAAVLGQREAEVARLVADGLSNKAIGARLFISERTVESHVRNILIKLGFTSRAQIAAWTASSGPLMR